MASLSDLIHPRVPPAIIFKLKNGVWTPDTDVDTSLAVAGSTWTLKDHNDTEETYAEVEEGGLVSSEALLDSITARNGYRQTLDTIHPTSSFPLLIPIIARLNSLTMVRC